MSYQTLADSQNLVRYFTKNGHNPTEQSKIYRRDPKLYESLKERGAQADRDFDEKLKSLDEKIAALQEQRRQLLRRGV
jgi:hypothetical protein